MFYKAVVQTVLLYVSEIWVVTEAMLKVIEGFNHLAAIRIVGMTAQRTNDRYWEWTLVT